MPLSKPPAKEVSQLTAGQIASGGQTVTVKHLKQALSNLTLPDYKNPQPTIQAYPAHVDLTDETKNPFPSKMFLTPPNLSGAQASLGLPADTATSDASLLGNVTANETKFNIAPIQAQLNFGNVKDPQLKRHLQTLWKRTEQACKLVNELFDHNNTIPCANANTDKGIKTHIESIEKLEDKAMSIYGDFSDKLDNDEIGSAMLDRITDALNSLSKQANQMRASCSLEQMVPEISAGHIKNISCPELWVTQYKPPGFFMTINRIVQHMKDHPVSGSYYVTHILERLKQNEPVPYQSITSGKQPESPSEIFFLLAQRFLMPNAVEAQMVAVLEQNGRMLEPGKADPKNMKVLLQSCF